MSTRGLFETIKVRGWRRNGGVSINAGGFRHYIVKKLYKEADRGAVFGQKLMDTFAGINTGVEMPVIDRHDEVWQYYLSQMIPSREAEYGIQALGFRLFSTELQFQLNWEIENQLS